MTTASEAIGAARPHRSTNAGSKDLPVCCRTETAPSLAMLFRIIVGKKSAKVGTSSPGGDDLKKEVGKKERKREAGPDTPKRRRTQNAKRKTSQ